ncbi:MAG: DMT family transporter [Rhizobiaceae bacterium]
MTNTGPATTPAAGSRGDERLGFLLVFLSAFVWSFGGALARYIEAESSWTVVFWRSLWAALFLIGFMLVRDGRAGTVALFRGMGLAGVVVAICFATASTSFIVALSFTTVANVVLIQAGVPLLAALIAWVVFRETVGPATWAAIAAVILGVTIMVSDSFSGKVSPVGDGLAVLIACAFATATVVTRRYAHVRMTPATCVGTMIAATVAFVLAPSLAVTAVDMSFLFAFGALNLGLGLACFTIGARLVPAAFAALIGTLETVLAPVWVWLAHGEIPSGRTIVGGTVVFVALLVHIGMELRRQARPTRPGVGGFPTPN